MVMSTQPGTSPRSRGPAMRRDMADVSAARARDCLVMKRFILFLPVWWCGGKTPGGRLSELEVEEAEPGVEREEHGHRQGQEDDGEYVCLDLLLVERAR
ncbi:hypothetical protein GCM10022399_42470 [Terrabacter ginsenosidimutans]|uniref:Uncharacterized protein n=1 Tax=Terrabacter ginsenosidimutans TaxID=490575 RepID=A0ABP7EQ14_9MICO